MRNSATIALMLYPNPNVILNLTGVAKDKEMDANSVLARIF